MDKLTENDLVVPVLVYLKEHGGFATIEQIREHIKNTYPLTPEDLKLSKKRKGECMYEQQIRNLTSHDKFEKLGVADAVDGGFRLRKGIAELIDNSGDWLIGRLNSGRRSNVIRREIASTNPVRRRVNLDEVTDEGHGTTARDVKGRRRSAKLRQAAMDHYARDGKIECYCCGMTFEAVYGPEYGISCIEIHHKKPLSMYEDEDLDRTIGEALKNVIPVCPNCHRVIHRNQLFTDSKLRNLRKKLRAE